VTLGVFDSGVGGLSVHRALMDRLPNVNAIYYCDQAHAPIGGKTGEDIVALTRDACSVLFDRGANLVVLACNTASAVALRRLQQTWLPNVRRQLGRPVNVLGIIVPTIEAATGLPWEHEGERRGEKLEKLDVIGVFSTPGTAASRVYEIEIDKRRQDVAVFSEPCPNLARLIETSASQDQLRAEIKAHVAALVRRVGRPPDRAILGCTHYEIIADLFRDALPSATPLIHQPTAVADSLIRYLERHPEYEISQGGVRTFLTSGPAGLANELVSRFWGGALRFETL